MDYYANALGFELIDDTSLAGEKRWILLAPHGSVETRLLLAKVSTPKQMARVGDQTGGRVFLFLHTDDFWRNYYEMNAGGVKFLTFDLTVKAISDTDTPESSAWLLFATGAVVCLGAWRRVRVRMVCRLALCAE